MSSQSCPPLQHELDACRQQLNRLEKRLQLAQEDQQRQEHINDNQRALLYKVNQEYENLLERNRQLTEELHGKNIHLSGIIDNTPTPILTLDATLQVVSCNPRAMEFFDLESEPCKHMGSFFPLEYTRKLERFGLHALEQGKAVTLETLYAPPGQSAEANRLLELTLFPIPRMKDHKAALCCLVHDLSPVREALAERIMQAQLVELGALSAGIAHEVNNPINGVMNYLQLCQDLVAMGELAEGQLEQNLLQAQNLAARVAGVVHAILNMAAPQNEPLTSFSISEVVDEALLLLYYQLRRNSIVLDLQLPPNLPDIEGKRVEVVQIIQNLLINAIQAHAETSNAGGKTIRIACHPHLEHGALDITVSDNGPGLNQELLSRLFHPFVTTREQGTGLGLYLCMQYAKSNGGTIVAANAPQGGAQFTLTLPAERAL